MTSSAERVRRLRERRKAEGGRILCVPLDGEAAGLLDQCAGLYNLGQLDLLKKALAFLLLSPSDAARMHREKLAERILTMFHAEGKHPRQIAAILNGAGVPTLSGRGRWAHSIIQTIIKKEG